MRCGATEQPTLCIGYAWATLGSRAHYAHYAHCLLSSWATHGHFCHVVGEARGAANPKSSHWITPASTHLGSTLACYALAGASCYIFSCLLQTRVPDCRTSITISALIIGAVLHFLCCFPMFPHYKAIGMCAWVCQHGGRAVRGLGVMGCRLAGSRSLWDIYCVKWYSAECFCCGHTGVDTRVVFLGLPWIMCGSAFLDTHKKRELGIHKYIDVP